MKTMFPIYVPSKARPNLKRGTIELLSNEGLDFNVVVEPQDYESYCCWIDSIVQSVPVTAKLSVLKLPKNDQGLAYARQFCKEHSAERGDEYHWSLDDDIRSFLSRFPGQPTGHPCAGQLMRTIEMEVLKYSNVGKAGTNQNSFPPGKNGIKVNYAPEQCHLINNSVEAKFTGKIFVDFQHSLRTLREGWCVLTFDHLRTNCPAIGSKEGGMQAVYRDKDYIISRMRELCEEFPPMSIEEDEKGPHLRRNRIWSTFKQEPTLI